MITARMTTLALALALLLAPGAIAGPLGLIDDFSGDLSAYTATRILKANGAAADNAWAWEISGGALQLNTTSFGGIEQFALTRTDYTLGVGEELQADFSAGYTGTQDIGLYVGAGHPTMDVREDYVNIYMRNNGELYSRGFNGTTELPLSGGGTPAVDTLFIARTDTDEFELGWYEGIVRNVLTTRTLANTDIGNAVGFYADVRSAGIVGALDNLRLIPEPGSALLVLLGCVSLVGMRRR